MTHDEAMAHAEAQRLREGILVARGSREEMVKWCIEHGVEKGITSLKASELAWHILDAVVRPPVERKEKKGKGT